MKKYNANKKEFYTLIILGLLFIGFTSPDPVKRKYSISQRWLTYPSESILFQPTAYESGIKSKPDKTLNIDINEQKVYQEMDGFGFTLTGGSARLINQMSTTNKKELLYELFSATEGIGISYLRLSIGASDLSDSVFTYNDMPPGKTDPQLKQFNMDMERVHLIPVLKEILAINPEIKIMGSPWSAPAWMKTNESAIGGSLRQEYFEAYSTYFVRYIEEMQKNNIHIDAITVQNEPLHPGNNPSMYMTAEQQAMFIKNNLGPALKKANLNTKIIIYDHNADRIDYPLEVLSDSEAYPYIDGTAFHLYGGNIEDISKVHTAFPDKNLYFTEQWIGAPGNLEEDLKWHTENLIIGATRNWCKTVLEWNLAADKYQQPHTDQGGVHTLSGCNNY